MVDKIAFDGKEYAVVIRSSFKDEGIHFFTPGDYSQQLGYMNRPKGYCIAPHIHNIVLREIQLTQEVLVVKKGKVLVKFFSHEKKELGETVINSGDVILLAYGGHGFEFLEETEMIEIKQGPYIGERDKVRF